MKKKHKHIWVLDKTGIYKCYCGATIKTLRRFELKQKFEGVKKKYESGRVLQKRDRNRTGKSKAGMGI